MPRTPIDVRDVLREVGLEMRSLSETRGIKVTAALGDEAAVISGNPPALHRLFLVLLDNALKYSAYGGEVLVTVVPDDARVAVSVEDFGTGISESDLPHIFERFYRADRVRGGEGHGLGLSFAECIARAHGATIEVHSVEGSGSTFRVVFSRRDLKRALANRVTKAGALAGS